MARTKDTAKDSGNRPGKTESRKIRIHTAASYYINVSRSFEEVAKFVNVPQATLQRWSKTAEWQAALKFWGFTGQKLRTRRKVKTPPPEVPYTLTERYLLIENFQADSDIIRFVTYNGFVDSEVKSVETYHIVLSNDEKIHKHDVLFAFPKSKMAGIKRGVKRQKQLADKNLGPIVKKDKRPKVSVRAKTGENIECIMRNGLVITGKNIWISKYNIVLRVGYTKGETRGKVALIYKHGLLNFKRVDTKSPSTVNTQDDGDDE